MKFSNPFSKKKNPDVEMKISQKANEARGEYVADEHSITLEELSARLGTNIDYADPKNSGGLTTALAEKRMAEEGKNILSPPKSTPEWIKYLLHYANFFMILLEFAATLSCIVYALDHTQQTSLYIGIFLYIVVVIDCTISYIQERSSSNVMQTFSKMLPQKCKVIRDGFERELPAEELVRGDLVKFTIGDKIPADMRIIFNQQAKVECSSITGESVPVSLTPEKTNERPSETRNLVFNGSLCMNGEAYGVVIRVGDKTLIGQIAQLAGAQSGRPTTLQLEIKHFVTFIAIISVSTALVFFIIGMARGQKFLPTFTNGFIVVILAFLPNGLPTAITSIISVCAKKMAKKNVYVKKLDIVETLGCTSLIASDKTGTLTQNIMSVVSVWCDGEFINFATGGPHSILLVDLLDDPTFKPILECASLCNRARYADDNTGATSNPSSPMSTEHEHEHDHEEQFLADRNKTISTSFSTGFQSNDYEVQRERMVIGDASDTAIFRFVNNMGIGERIRRQHPKVFEIPFNSTVKYSIAIVQNNYADDSGTHKRHTLYMKGAPEVILGRCSYFLHKGEVKPVDADFTQNVTTSLRRSAASGERVLGLCMTHIDSPPEEYIEDPPNFPSSDLIFLGLFSLMDPPRPNVPDAIKILKKASVKIIMVTGDHPITAEAIARKVNIIGSAKTRAEVAAIRGVNQDDVLLKDSDVQAVVVTGTELLNFTDDMWNTVLSKKEIVFARTTPTQKLEIVERNQARGYVVAVTGDGVNDSPALKQADVGVAMGKMGSDVAREAADIILITDDFSAILDAVKMGRLIFDNLRKTLAYTLPHVIPELIPVLCTLTFNLPLALNSILILVIDLGTEMAPSISLAYEKPESNIMNRPPRNTKRDKMASYQILVYAYILVGVPEVLVCFIAYFLVYINHGIPVSSLSGTYGTYWQSGAPDLVVNGKTFADYDQVNIYNESQAAFFLTVVACQFWHIWFARTSRASSFRRRPRNVIMIMGVIISACITVIVIYVPFLQPIVETSDLTGGYWLINLIFLAYIMPLTEVTKLLARNNKKGFVAKHLVW